MINKLSANELLEKMSKQREKYWNKAYKLGQKAERERILDKDELSRKILEYCQENKIYGSYNWHIKDWLVSFGIKKEVLKDD